MTPRQKQIINRLIAKTNEKILSVSFKVELKNNVSEIMDLFKQLPEYNYLDDGSKLVEQFYQEFTGIEEIS